jgi:signal transduction histidine kinase
MTLKSLKKFASLIGPYPYNPTFIFLFFFALYFSRYISLILEQPKGPLRWEAGGLILAIALLPSFIFAIFAYLVQRYRFWSQSNLFFYILEVATCQTIVLLIHPVMQTMVSVISTTRIETAVTASINIYLASLALTLTALALMHRAERSISNRSNEADELVSRLESDREELVNSGEELRRQTSQFLHDRVQSDLMVIGMNLKSVSGKSSSEVDVVLDEAGRLLERIRTSDIRNLVQILSPNFEVGGLSEALDQLNSQYLKIMDVTVNIEIESEKLEPKQLLGIFRIVEQALLNSLIHGPADKASVTIEHTGTKDITLIVSDNGPGVGLEETKFGVGSAVIDSWVSILKGRKEIISSPGNGYKLEVVFPRTSVN